MAAWIGVDFDGTLAHYVSWKQNGENPGSPIEAMQKRVKYWLHQGRNVKILTARVSSVRGAEERERMRKIVQDWCKEHLGRVLEVTAEKDLDMVQLWDDRCVTVETNTGAILTEGARVAVTGR